MKTFNGSSWLKGDKDTGWRNISYAIDPSVIPYYYRGPSSDGILYQVRPGELELNCQVRRKDFRVDLVLDVVYVDPVYKASYATIIPSGSSSPLSKIGLPIGTILSKQRLQFPASLPTQGKTEANNEYIYVSGKGADTLSSRSGELRWIGSIYMAVGRFQLSWVTSDPFPTTLPGTGI